jgi:hypothetical protein
MYMQPAGTGVSMEQVLSVGLGMFENSTVDAAGTGGKSALRA